MINQDNAPFSWGGAPNTDCIVKNVNHPNHMDHLNQYHVYNASKLIGLITASVAQLVSAFSSQPGGCQFWSLYVPNFYALLS